MSAAPPFSMSPEAAEYIRSRLSNPRPGQELALITCLRHSEMIDGKEEVIFDGEHFIFGFYDIGQRPHAQHVELFGHQVSMVSSTLESLRGRTLTIRRVVERRSKVETDVLVAS